MYTSWLVVVVVVIEKVVIVGKLAMNLNHFKKECIILIFIYLFS